MQQLLARVGALDPQASESLRVIACFDELVVGNVNTRALLAAAAALSGCAAGFRQLPSGRVHRVSPTGDPLPAGAVPDGAMPDGAVPDGATVLEGDGQQVWLERSGPAAVNDAIVLERLALALRVRHGLGRAEQDMRRDLGVVVDGAATADERRGAAGRLGLHDGTDYRVLVAPLFAAWHAHPVGPEDVVSTPWGPLHTVVVPADAVVGAATPSGLGVAAAADRLDRSFRTALVALRLCEPDERGVDATAFGGLVEVLADLPHDVEPPELARLDEVLAHAWGPATIAALVHSGSVRQAARVAEVHHSTMQTRLDLVAGALGFDPLDGFGRARLGVAWLVWRMRHSRALELPTR